MVYKDQYIYNIVLFEYLNRNHCNDNSDDVGQHVIGVTNQHQRVNNVTTYEFNQEEHQRQTEHRTQPTDSSVHSTRPPHRQDYPQRKISNFKQVTEMRTWYLYTCTRVHVWSTCTCTWGLSTCTCTCTWDLSTCTVLVLVLEAWVLVLVLVLEVLVPQLSPNIQKNCAFCDTSTKFGTNVH